MLSRAQRALECGHVTSDCWNAVPTASERLRYCNAARRFPTSVMTCDPFFKFPVQLHAILKVVRCNSSNQAGNHTTEMFMRSVSGIPESLSVADCRIALVYMVSKLDQKVIILFFLSMY